MIYTIRYDRLAETFSIENKRDDDPMISLYIDNPHSTDSCATIDVVISFDPSEYDENYQMALGEVITDGD